MKTTESTGKYSGNHRELKRELKIKPQRAQGTQR
jgi:hypothetical protein